MLYLDQQLVAIAAAFPHQLQLRRRLPAGMLIHEMLVPHHACRSVSMMTQASRWTPCFLSRYPPVYQQQGQQAHLDTKRSCLCRIPNVTGCDDVYTSSKASPCIEAHHVYSCFKSTMACLFWCLSKATKIQHGRDKVVAADAPCTAAITGHLQFSMALMVF